jgi:hypothetical protein
VSTRPFFDAAEFLKGLDLADRLIREEVGLAMGQIGLDILDDATQDIPSVPFEKGTLRGSGSVILVDRGTAEVIATSEGGGDLAPDAPPPTPSLSADGAGPIDLDGVTVLVGFNTPYAARLHEHPEYNFTEPGSGADYLASKIVPQKDEHMASLAERIRTRLEGGR